MAINLTGLSSSVNAGTRSKASDSSANTQQGLADKLPASTAQNQPETVKLSSEAQMLNKLEEQLTKLPDANQERIANIKQSIENGTFSINAERIAEKLTSLEGQLFS
jgi:negative regulator of flagellin synthesis FlgM